MNIIDKINILGINVSKLSRTGVIEKINEFLFSDKQRYVVTPNPEIILTAIGHDEELFYILNNADLSVSDGFGLNCAAWAMFKNLHRIAGADLLLDILKLAEEKNKKVLVLAWDKGLSSAQDIKSALNKKFPQISVLVQEINRAGRLLNITEINNFKPDLIITGLGAPWQEKINFHNLKNIPSAKLAIGVGGSFDFLTEKIKRAPKVMRFLGIEWIWRLIKQPWRWRRIYNAVIVFPGKFIAWRFIYPFFYRSNVVCMLYKKEDDKYKFLLVERKIEKGHWQLPQGGTDREDLMTAGSRELKEEINTDKFKAVYSSKKIYTYEFKEKLSKFNITAKQIWGYKGQKQGLFIAEFFGQDSDIKVNFWEHTGWKWVDSENLVNEVHPSRKEAVEKFHESFKEYLKNI